MQKKETLGTKYCLRPWKVKKAQGGTWYVLKKYKGFMFAAVPAVWVHKLGPIVFATRTVFVVDGIRGEYISLVKPASLSWLPVHAKTGGTPRRHATKLLPWTWYSP